MYALTLTESYCPAQTDEALLDTTVGGVLRDVRAWSRVGVFGIVRDRDVAPEAYTDVFTAVPKTPTRLRALA